MKNIEKILRTNKSLAEYSHIKIGGTADLVCEPRDRQELCDVIDHCNSHKISYKVIGRGSNIFFADAGFRGCIICLRAYEPDEIRFFDNEVYASAAMTNNAFVRNCAAKDLGGMECIACIPGTLGGALVMNAGCKDHLSQKYHEIGTFVRSVTVLTHGQEKMVPAGDITFRYRHSSLQGSIVLGARFALEKKSRMTILDAIKENMKVRNAIVPWERKTLGSVFRNPKNGMTSAGELLDRAGMKKERQGDIVVSARHANVFENKGKGTAKDMWFLIEQARKRVYEKDRVRLELEIGYIE